MNDDVTGLRQGCDKHCHAACSMLSATLKHWPPAGAVNVSAHNKDRGRACIRLLTDLAVCAGVSPPSPPKRVRAVMGAHAK